MHYMWGVPQFIFRSVNHATGNTANTGSHVSLTHWGWVMHICVSKLTTIGSDNGLSPGRCQAIIWPSAGILLIGPLGTNFSEMLIGIHTFSFKKMHLKMPGKCRPFCFGLNVSTTDTHPYCAPTPTVPRLGLWNSQRHSGESGLNLGLCPANERHPYKVTPSLIGWAQT